MNIEQKVAALQALYRIEEAFGKSLDTVCREGCASCCTARVAMTTLEGYHIAAYIKRRGQDAKLAQIRNRMTAERFRPRTTTNGLVEICLAGGDPPAEALDGDAGICPLLEEARCPVYPVRPLACRTMRSRADCAATGFADMDDFSVTVSTVLMQYVEQIDADGCSGNFADIMGLFASAANRAFYAEGRLPCTEPDLVNNRPISALMIPPEHRQRIQPLLEQIARIRV